jgi:hypothetical protein
MLIDGTPFRDRQMIVAGVREPHRTLGRLWFAASGKIRKCSAFHPRADKGTSTGAGGDGSPEA